jgi:acetolactate synthase-1/2/3 large subunit
VLLPLIDALRQEGIRFVLARHETAATYMAEATWRLTGAPGVVLGTLGPGATQLVSGIAGAWLDRAPVVAITGDIGSRNRTIYTHQILDQQALFRPITHRSVTLTTQEAWREIPLTLRHLTSGRPGPVHLNLPAEVATAEQPGFWTDRFQPALACPTPRDLDETIALVRSARRPVIAVGCGDLSDRVDLTLYALAHQLKAPVMVTYKAKGILNEADTWYAGAFGLSPVIDEKQQALLRQADLLVTVGLDPAELRAHWLPGWPEDLAVVAVDETPPVDLVHPQARTLVGNIPLILQQLAVSGASSWHPRELVRHRQHLQVGFDDGPDGPAATIRALRRALPAEGICTLDVGAHRITACHAWTCSRPRRLLQSNGLATMGYALPAAIGAALASPDTPVMAITGDMGLWMVAGELGTAAEQGLDLVVVYLSDATLSLIALKQERMGLADSGMTFENPQVVPLARAFGGVGVQVRGQEAVEAAAKEALEAGGLRIIEAVIDPQAYRDQM